MTRRQVELKPVSNFENYQKTYRGTMVGIKLRIIFFEYRELK